MLSGILYPTGGDVKVSGFIPHLREKPFLKNITFVAGQRNRLFWDLPAEEYFEFCRIVYEIPEPAYRKNLRDLIELAEIGNILKTPQRKLSAGERKRCEIVAALIHDPKVIFLDEPTNALDLVNARKIRELVRERGKSGDHTIILTSHNMADIEQVCERVIIINRGRIVFDGGVADLYRVKGTQRRIRVLFRQLYSRKGLEHLGRILKTNGLEVWLEVDPQGVASVSAYLFSHFEVQDISIMDPPLEGIIEGIYRESLSPSVSDGIKDRLDNQSS
jgi:ABC-2 type transport system ATP-binding protein